MATVGIRELKARASEIVQRAAEGESFLVTKRGKPVAVILPFGIDAEDLILAEAPRFMRLRAEARKEFRGGLTTGWQDLKARRETSARSKSRRAVAG